MKPARIFFKGRFSRVLFWWVYSALILGLLGLLFSIADFLLESWPSNSYDWWILQTNYYPEYDIAILAFLSFLFAFIPIYWGLGVLSQFIRWFWSRQLIQPHFTYRRLKLYLKLSPFLFGLAILLFYVEEDWRGWKDWNHCRQELETQGEHLNWDYYVPPPVPDEQNFAKAPVWTTTCSFTSPPAILKNSRLTVGVSIWRNGVLLPDQPPSGGQDGFINRNFPPGLAPTTMPGLSLIKMPSTHPYAAPHIGRWMLSELTDLNTWQFYYHLPQDPHSPGNPPTNEFPVSAQAQSPAATVLLALSKYDSAIEELRQASLRPAARFPLNYGKEHPNKIWLQHLGLLVQYSRVLQFRTIAEIAGGHTNEAMADLKLIFSLAESVRDEPFYSSQLFRGRIIETTIQPIWEGLARQQWSDAQLMTLDHELARLDALTSYRFAMQAERAATLKTVECMRHDYSARTIVNMNGDALWFPTLIFWLWPDGWFNLAETELAKVYTGKLPTLNEVQHHIMSPETGNIDRFATNWPTTQSEYYSYSNYSYSNYRFLVSHLFSYPDTRAWAKVQNSTDMARIACALERYRHVHGTFPETLGALVPHFMASVPTDIINGQPLRYHQTSDGLFILYSVGWNEKDDGGLPPPACGDPNFSIPNNTGDWVWRYPSVSPQF